MVPNSAQPTGKKATSAKGKATLLNNAVAREIMILLASDLGSRNKYLDPRKTEFLEATADSEGSEEDFSEYDTDETSEVIQSLVTSLLKAGLST